MYPSKLRSQTKTKTKSKNKNNSTSNSMEFANTPADLRQTLSIVNTPKIARLTNIESARSSNIESPFKFIQMIDRRFDKLAEQLQCTIKDTFLQHEERLLKEIEKSLNIVKSDMENLSQRVSSLESYFNDLKNSDIAKVVELTNETKELKNEIAHLKDIAKKHENSIVASDLRIIGVPERQNEDLVNTFAKICQAVNIRSPEVLHAYRVRSKTNLQVNASAGIKPRSDPPIVVKLKSPFERNYVLKSITSYIKNTKDVLRLNILGLDSSVPFYVNENLTSANHRIFLQAHRLKKQKLIFAAYVNRGLVYIKQNEREEPVCIYDCSQLNMFRDDSTTR